MKFSYQQIVAAISNASNAANEAYLSKDRQQIVNAYVHLNNLAGICREHGYFFRAREANDMADDLSYHL